MFGISEVQPVVFQRFAAVIMRIREPRTTALIFSSGKMVCTGAKRSVCHLHPSYWKNLTKVQLDQLLSGLIHFKPSTHFGTFLRQKDQIQPQELPGLVMSREKTMSEPLLEQNNQQTSLTISAPPMDPIQNIESCHTWLGSELQTLQFSLKLWTSGVKVPQSRGVLGLDQTEPGSVG